jgi:membrane fusion protein (multidrug efflux system)
VASAFRQTIQAVDAERPRAAMVGLGILAALSTALLVWFFRAHVTVYEVSKSARVETLDAAHSIDAPVGARVHKTMLVLGARVHAGDVLVELDAEQERRRVVEEETRLATVAPEIEALRRVLDARDIAVANDRAATEAALQEGRARERQAQAAAELASEELARAARLGDAGAISDLELIRARADAKRRQIETQALALGLLKQVREQKTRESQSFAGTEDLRRDLATLEGRQATSRATLDELRNEIDRRTIRAPVSGRVEDVAPIGVGAFVREGERLASVVPTGDLRVIGEFTPSTTVGRVEPGQAARIRLDSYPWTQYGDVRARVTSIGTEVRQGSVRVELEITDAGRIPLRHGLTGSAEIAVELATPAALVLRTVGKMTRPPAPAASAQAAASGSLP